MRENCFTVKKKFSAYQEVQPKKVNVKKLLNPSKEVSLLDTIISWVYLTKFPICRALIFSTKSTITEVTVNDQATEIIRPLDENQKRAVVSTIGLLQLKFKLKLV